MTHPITELQGALVPALLADSALITALGGDFVFDAPPKGGNRPYVLIARHDLLPRDGDETPGNEHRLTIEIWHSDASRAKALALAERVIAVLDAADLDTAGLMVTHRNAVRTDTAIDTRNGGARASVQYRFFSEPAA